MESQAFAASTLTLVRNADRSTAPSLLREVTALYVADPLHSDGDRRLFDELSARLLRITPEADRQVIASALARCDRPPPVILQALLRDVFDVSSRIAHGAALEERELLAIASSYRGPILSVIAARRRLPQSVADVLLERLSVDQLPILLGNPDIRLTRPAVDFLVEIARERPDIAEALATRVDDVQDADLAGLFLILGARGRRRVVDGLELAALRALTAGAAAVRRAPPADTVERLSRACIAGRRELVLHLLAGLTGLAPAFVAILMADRGGEPLAVALRGSGIGSGPALRVLLFSGPSPERGLADLRRLVALHERLSERAAALMLAFWRGAGHQPPVRPVPAGA